MDVGTTNGWRLDEVVPASEVIETIGREWPLEAEPPTYPGEVAERWRYADGTGEIGVIASVTRPFCGDCTRARISAEGKLYTCLFSAIGHDLREPLRAGRTDAELSALVAGVWGARDDRYSERRAAATDRLPKLEMFALGG
jgi:cyclic pyranopterin phosphate synthase